MNGLDKKMKKILIIIIIGVMIILAIGGYFYFGGDREQESDIEDGQEILLEGEEWFQTGNAQDIIQLQHIRSPELENNRMGDMVTLQPQVHKEEPDSFANRISDAGLKWMRISIDTFDLPEVENPGLHSEYNIYPEQDAAITALNNNGIKPMYVLVFWDEEIQSSKGYSRFKTEEEIQDFLDYVQFIVGHFKDKIEYYEILNEPNAREGTQQYVESDDYITVARRVIPIIRQEDPEAKIVVGAITPLYEPSAKEYFFNILSSDIMPLVDGVSFHGIGPRTSPEYEADDYYGYPALLQEIKDTASSHGFTGEYIAAELHYRTEETYHEHEPWVHSNIEVAKYMARGIIIQSGMDFTTGTASCLECSPTMEVLRGMATIMAGATPTNLQVQIQSQATNIEYYTFSLSNGDKLIALWTDGTAVDDDSGVSADLIINDISSEEVIGIDVLESYQQSITTSNENGNLVINDLIVRDYPLVIKIK